MLETVVTAVAFGDEVMQIQYLEAASQSSAGSLEESLTVQLNKKTGALAEEIKEALVEIIDDYKLHLRNPPEHIGGGGNRFLGSDEDEAVD